MDLRLGRIYRIYFNDIVYIGSTFRTLQRRWTCHKSQYNQFLKQNARSFTIFPYLTEFGVDNFKIELIKEYFVIDEKHLRVYETLAIKRFKCVNERTPTNFKFLEKLHMKDWNRQYRLDNIEEIKQRDKKYKQEHKEKFKEKDAKYYAEKRDKILAQKKEYHAKNAESIREKKRIYTEKKRVAKILLQIYATQMKKQQELNKLDL